MNTLTSHCNWRRPLEWRFGLLAKWRRYKSVFHKRLSAFHMMGIAFLFQGYIQIRPFSMHFAKSAFIAQLMCVRILAGFFLKIYTSDFFIDALFGNHMVCYWWKQFFCHQEKIELGTGAHSNAKCGQYFMAHFLQLIDGLLLFSRKIRKNWKNQYIFKFIIQCSTIAFRMVLISVMLYFVKKLDRIFCHKNTLLRNSFHIVRKWLWSKEKIRQVVNNTSCISLCTISLLKIWKYIQWSFWNNLPLNRKNQQASACW